MFYHTNIQIVSLVSSFFFVFPIFQYSYHVVTGCLSYSRASVCLAAERLDVWSAVEASRFAETEDADKWSRETEAENNIFCQILNTSKTSFVIFDLLIEVMKSMGFKMPNKYSRMHYM